MKFMIILFAFMGILFAGCRVSDIRELTINVPGLATDADEQSIRKAIAPLNGVNKELLVFDKTSHTLKVTFDSMVIANKNIEIAIAEAGYDANKITAASARVKK